MVIPSGEDNIAIIHCLKELDCCSRCILRLSKLKIDTEIYKNPEAYLNELLKEDLNMHAPKKVKKNACLVCLGTLQDFTLERMAENVKFSKINEYHNYLDFVIHTSLPKSVMIRNHSMCIYLKQKFPEMYSDFTGIDTISKVFKVTFADIVSQIISKSFNPKSNLVITCEVEYEDDNLEVCNIRKLNVIRKDQQQNTSKNIIAELLSKCEDDLFQKYFSLPPDIPSKETTVKIHCMAESIWIGGRYLKFSRDMGQTPWIINNKAMTENNIQEIIFDSLEKILGCGKNSLTFCASGREDADVRMLGNGRPFYIQIDDPKMSCVTFDQCRAIEMEVFQSKLAAVVKLQNIPKSHLKRIKDGEQNKRKHYYALCQINAIDMNNVIDIINGYKNEALQIFQKTPLRVLHRRSQAIRKKCIYYMDAEIVKGHSNLINVKLITQAGTYVKEFVNGDFERTQPSLKSILKLPIDVVTLDVTNIDLVWPEG